MPTPNINPPDTYACGMFGLSLKIAKIARLAAGTKGNERIVAQTKLWREGFFLDKAGILWDSTAVPCVAQDAEYAALLAQEVADA